MTKLFLTAYLQVFFVSANVYFISNKIWIGVAICGFAISYLWTLNVKKIAISRHIDKIVYSFGATLGGLSGVFLSDLIKSLIVG